MALEDAGEMKLVAESKVGRELGEPPVAIAGKAPFGFLDAQPLDPSCRTQPRGTTHEAMNGRWAHFQNAGERCEIQSSLEVVAHVELE